MTEPVHRRIRSFVLRAGRMTEGQQKAMEAQWPIYGRALEQGPLNLPSPVVVELGFGMGASLLQQCKAEPEKNFVGIEVHPPGVGRLLSQAAEAGVDNLTVYQEDGIEVLNQCIPAGSVDRFQLYFPDPWHKKRHHKRRIVQADFVALVHQKLSPGGVFHMATDWAPYAEHMQEVMAGCPEFEDARGGDRSKPDWRPVTKFQTRGEKLGHGVWDLVYRAL